MLYDYFTRKLRGKAEGRNEETEEMRLRNSMLKIFRTLDWNIIARDTVKIVFSRVIEKLYVLRIQEPSVFFGVEEDIEWIQRKLMEAWVEYYSYSPKELMDVAYHFEDVIDDLILRSISSKAE